MLKIYGIKNCDTVKKALKWLDQNKIKYEFHDYKKLGADSEILKKFIDKFGWEKTLNLKSRTWRSLADNEKPDNEIAAIALAKTQTSIIKRPLLSDNKDIFIIGFKEAEYEALLG